MLLDVTTLLQYCCNILCHLCIKKKLLQNTSKVITKLRSFLIIKRGKVLLENAAAFLLQNASILLQNAAGITKHVIYSKAGHNITTFK